MVAKSTAKKKVPTNRRRAADPKAKRKKNPRKADGVPRVHHEDDRQARVRYDTVTNDGKRIGRTIQINKGKDGKYTNASVQLSQAAAEVLLGKVDYTTWTDEELIKGYQGNRPNPQGILPLEMHQELARRVMSRAQHRFTAELEYAIEKLFAIIKEIDPMEPSAVQMKAIEMIMDRVLGKAPEILDVNISGPKPYEGLMQISIVADAEQLAATEEAREKMRENSKVIDVEPVEDADLV